MINWKIIDQWNWKFCSRLFQIVRFAASCQIYLFRLSSVFNYIRPGSSKAERKLNNIKVYDFYPAVSVSKFRFMEIYQFLDIIHFSLHDTKIAGILEAKIKLWYTIFSFIDQITVFQFMNRLVKVILASANTDNKIPYIN